MYCYKSYWLFGLSTLKLVLIFKQWKPSAMMEWVPMLDHQMQCSPNSSSGFVFLQNAKMQNCKTAKLQKCKTAPRCTWCSIDTLRPNLIRAGVRETKTSRDRLFHLKTLTIGPFLPLARLSLMSPDRGRWSIFNPTPAFIQTLSHEMYTFKVIHCIQSLPSSLLQIGQILFSFTKK